MAINARNQLDQTSLAMKQVCLGHMLVQAKAVQERGQLKKAPVPCPLAMAVLLCVSCE